MDEASFINWLRGRIHCGDETVIVGAGSDDCAILRAPAGRIAVTTDMLLENTHFTADAVPEDVGWKAMAVNLSDLAASGCEPRWAVAAVGLRQGLPSDYGKRLAEGLLACAERFGVSLVGGDTTAGKGPISIAVTALGETLPGGPLLRSGARPGDILAVTGELGGSLLGKHLRFTPRVKEIRALLDLAPVHACIDISDGLALDLCRLMSESGCGAVIEEALVPIADDAVAMAHRTGRDPLEHALADGEDFELLLAIPLLSWQVISAAWPLPSIRTPLRCLGKATVDKAIRLLRRDGREEVLAPKGYQHQW